MTRRERLLAKVKATSSDGCWQWTAHVDAFGYGRFQWVTGVSIGAHQAAYRLFVGEVPTGLELDHLCRNRARVNPRHLEAVTHRENMMRGDGVGSANAAKTRRIHGHEFTSDNTYLRPNGRRQCRVCNAEAAARYQRRLKAVAA